MQVCVTIMIYGYIANFIASSALVAKSNHACNIMHGSYLTGYNIANNNFDLDHNFSNLHLNM